MRNLGKAEGRRGIHVLGVERCDQRPQHRRILSRSQGKSLVDDDSSNVGVEDRRAKGVLEAADEDWLVDEGIQCAAKFAPFGAKRRPVRRRHARDDQCLEIGSVMLPRGHRRWHELGNAVADILAGVPVVRIVPKRPCHHGAYNAMDEVRRGSGIVRRRMVSQRGQHLSARIGEIGFCNR